MTEQNSDLQNQIKSLLIENLMLQLSAEDIAADQPLFGPNSLGLDSVDALQIVVALDKKFGLKITHPDAARQILQSVNSMAKAVREKQELEKTLRNDPSAIPG
jgi:acyl carrier protein